MNYVAGLMKKLMTNEEEEKRPEPREFKAPPKPGPTQTPTPAWSPRRTDQESTRMSSRLVMETPMDANRHPSASRAAESTGYVSAARTRVERRTETDTLRQLERSKTSVSELKTSKSAAAVKKRS